MRLVSFVKGEHFHVFNRGNSKQTIFKSEYDYIRFIQLLYIANSAESYDLRNSQRAKINPYDTEINKKIIDIHAYCLMPNHYHLVLSAKTENGITKFMQKLGTGYSMYFNKKYERTGSLFEGKFKAKHADTDEYLKYLFSYIHMNPLTLMKKDTKTQSKSNTFTFLAEYPYSSLGDYMNTMRPQSILLDKNMYEGYLNNTTDVYRELQDWLEFEYAT